MWHIIGAMNISFGSFSNKDRADEYAAALRALRNLVCEVKWRL